MVINVMKISKLLIVISMFLSVSATACTAEKEPVSSSAPVIEKQEGLLIVDTASRATVLSADSIGGMLIVEKQNESSAYRPILLKLVLMKVKGKGFCNVFTYEDLVTNGVHPQESVVSVNGTLKLSYAVGKGKYILYDPQGQSGIFLSIE